MGLFDLFRKGPAEPAAAPVPPGAPRPAGERRFHQDLSLMFDLAYTQRVVGLVAVPRDARDHLWSERFHDAVWTASIYVPQPAVVAGPDGMPYLRLILPSEGVAFDSQCLANLAPGCIGNLSGAALFTSEGDPPDAAHYVFTMGVLDSLLRYDSPDGDPQDVSESALPAEEGIFSGGGDGVRQHLVVEKTHDVLVGTPSADYLPPHTAHALWRYLRQVWHLDEPRVAILADRHMRPTRSLVIGRKRSEFAPDQDIDLMIRYLSWYLPPLRLVMLMPEAWRIEDMTPLSELFDPAAV